MPAYCIFHIRNALALDCLHNDCCWHTFCLSCFRKCCTKLVKIIAILDCNHVEVECCKLVCDRIWGINFLDRTINLQIVIIYNDAEVIQMMGSGKHRCLPYLSFLNLAITQKRVHTIILIRKFCGKCHTYSNRNALSQRSAGSVNSRCMLDTWMSLQVGSDMAQCQKVFYWEISSVRKCGIKPRCGVSLR